MKVHINSLFEMMSRFQQETRAKNTLLIIVGYSFGDAHINAMIYEALNVNSSITVIFVAPDAYDENKYERLKEVINQTGNIILTSQTFNEFVESYPYSEIYSQVEKEVIMSKINPFDNNHFIGYISFVSPQFAKVHFPSSTLLNKTIFSGEEFNGGLVGNFVTIEAENSGFIGKISEIDLPEKKD